MPRLQANGSDSGPPPNGRNVPSAHSFFSASYDLNVDVQMDFDNSIISTLLTLLTPLCISQKLIIVKDICSCEHLCFVLPVH